MLGDPVNWIDSDGLHGEKNPIDAIVSIWGQGKIGRDIKDAYDRSHPAFRVVMACATAIASPAAVSLYSAVNTSKNITDFIDGLAGGQPTNKAKAIGGFTRKIIKEVAE